MHQNAPFSTQKSKKISGEGQCPLPDHFPKGKSEKGNPLPTPHPSCKYIVDLIICIFKGFKFVLSSLNYVKLGPHLTSGHPTGPHPPKPPLQPNVNRLVLRCFKLCPGTQYEKSAPMSVNDCCGMKSIN